MINDFSARGYLDNRQFGQWFVEMQKRRGKSNRAIRAELYKRGIGRELADELMASEGVDEIERLIMLIAKKQKTSRYQNDSLKLAKYLTSQGFSFSLVKEVLKL